MRSFKGSQNFVPSSTQGEIYSPSRTNYQNRVLNATQNSKNKNRAQQIVSLHQEFEDLKKKIKQVENKNQKIIQKIHRQCNFKKKNPQTFDVSGDNTAPIVYYQKKEKSQISQVSGVSVDQSNKSDQSEYEFRQKKNPVQRNSVQSNKHIGSNMFSQSMQYSKPEPRVQKVQKKYSQIPNYQYEENSIYSQQLMDDQYEYMGPELSKEMRFDMQNSHQTYTHLKDYGNNGKQYSNSGKKSTILPPYPVSQTHMGYSVFPQPRQQQIVRHSNQSSHQSQSQFPPIYQLQEALKVQRQKIAFLEQQLKNKQTQILSVKKDYNKIVNQFDNLEMILENHLDNFMENVVKKGFFDIQKVLKKNQNKVRNLSIKIKDQYEEHKSSKLIKQHQLRRSNSRSRRDLSPGHNTSMLSVIGLTTSQPGHQSKIPRPSNSPFGGSSLVQMHPADKRDKSKASQQTKKNKQFEEIVTKYEQMINSKNMEISKLELLINTLNKKNQSAESQLDSKEKQVKQIRVKMQQLQRLMSETYNEVPIMKNTLSQKGRKRVSSAQSNLLQDIYQDLNEEQHRQTQFQLKYLEAKQQLQQKQSKIDNLQTQILNLQRLMQKQARESSQSLKIQKNSNRSSSNSASLTNLNKQKIQQSIKKKLSQLHISQISQKQIEIKKLQSQINLRQKKIVQKDCQIISLQNKVNKFQGITEINLKKIQEYEKLLNQYQHNNSVDLENTQYGNLLLDRSLCNDLDQYTSRSTTGIQSSIAKQRSSKKNVLIPRAELESLQSQIQSMNDQILSLTKKLKIIQNSSKQNNIQYERLNDEVQNLTLEKQKILKENHSLNERLNELLQFNNNQQISEHDQNQFNDEENLVYEDLKNNNSIYSNNSKPQRNSRSGRPNNLPRKNTNDDILVELQHKQQIQTKNLQSQHEQTKKRLEEEIETLKIKNLQMSKQLAHLKSDHLQVSRSNITLKKDNEYLHESLSDREQKYERFKKQSQELKVKLNEMAENCQKKDEQLKKQKQQNCQKIQQLQRQWHQFEQEINKNNNQQLQTSMDQSQRMQNSQHLKSSRYNFSESSLLLSSTIHNKNSQYLQEQNEYLAIKLKQAEATIEMHNMMEQKVLNEYKVNVQKLKHEIKDKNKQCDNLKKQNEIIKDSKRRLQIMYESTKNQLAESKISQNHNSIRKRQNSEYSNKKSQKSFQSNKKPIQINQSDNKDFILEQFPSYNEQTDNLSMLSAQQIDQMAQQADIPGEQRLNPYQKILQLESQLKQSKQINKKLQQMQEQLFKQIRVREQEKKDLLKLLDEKNFKIQQLQQIVELKQMNVNSSHVGSNLLGSHISSSNHKSSSQNKHRQNNLSQRQSMHSHSSLRYSGITHNNRHPTLTNPSSNQLTVMGQSHYGTSQRFQIELSQTGSEMLDQSYVTNISQIFQREQFPYEKVQLKRKQQIKLFEKTASYIKSLKDSINEKNKRIKLLQKKIESLKNNHHGAISKQLESKYEISTGANDKEDYQQIQVDNVFKDYQSVQLQRKKASHNKRYKNLQHQWKLALQQNNVLVNQIQALQQQIQKSQQQQNNLLKIKDIYKQQIKKLITKNQTQTTYYEELLLKQKRKVEQSQSVHNIQTLKQLFLKVIDSIILMESQKSKKKRQQKRKQIEQFFKIFASLSAIDQNRKNKIVEGIRKMTLNIVLAEQGRSSSSSKRNSAQQ